jgi:hypothetical protein
MKFEMAGQHYNYLGGFNDKQPGTKVTIEFEAEQLQNILEEFTMFLRGCGFIINGTLDVIPDEEYYAATIRTDNSMD